MVTTALPEAEARTDHQAKTPLKLIDADVHNYVNSIDELLPFLATRWHAYIEQSGFEGPGGNIYPRLYENAARRDSFPPSGCLPGGDPDFARDQLLDGWGIDAAILNPLYVASSLRNLDFANDLSRAVNELTAARWLDHDPRWRGSIVVNVEDPDAAAAEIRRAGRDPRFVQVLLIVRAVEPYGRRRYRPILAAASDMGLPLGIHFGGNPGPITATGWPSFYIEDHTGMPQAFEAQVLSLVAEGVFESFPDLRVALVEGGFAWLPALMWRFDKNYKGLRDEVPWLKKLPSEYIREHFRATTQPMEEPDDPRHLLQIMDMIGRDDFLMFATDYPHWDFDAPDRAVPSIVPDDVREGIMSGNAAAFYDFDRA
ncbi:MAG: amidohydrolase family protein [Chloroflexi bacterium]|nr:amidohydrolase family protein [Chloroflexota bacterium]